MIGNNFQPSKRETCAVQKQKYALLTAKKHRLATSGESRERNVLVAWYFERRSSRNNCCEHWRWSDSDDFPSFCENMVDQNGIVLITAFLSDHKLKNYQEILNLLSKTERIELFKAVVDFCLAKTSPLATAGMKIYKWIHSKQWAEKDFVFYVKGASSVRNKVEELTLNISLFTIGRNLQFFNCHELVMFSDRHQLSKSSFQWFDSIKITPVERLKNFVPRFIYIYCWSLHLISWKSFLEFPTKALCRRFDVGWAMLRNKHGTATIVETTHLVR